MNITNSTLDGALIEASKQLGCSVVEIDYEIISHPRKGFLGLFARPAVIKVNKFKKQDLSKNDNCPDENIQEAKITQKEHKTPIKLSPEQLEKCTNDIKQLLNLLCDVQVQISQLESGVLDVKITCEDESALIGKDNFKYSSLDILINHYSNINFNLHSRIDLNGCLNGLCEQLFNELNSLCEQINTQGKAYTSVLSPSLLNIAYEYFLKLYPQKIINIKDNAEGRYICVWGQYNEHHRSSSKRKH